MSDRYHLDRLSNELVPQPAEQRTFVGVLDTGTAADQFEVTAKIRAFVEKQDERRRIMARVEEETAAIQPVLHPGETIEGFVATALRIEVERRQPAAG